MAVPDVVVGVDFGMTSTGVAYSAGPAWARPETIQNWPNIIGGMIADKVATKIAYNNEGQVASWGFLIDDGLLARDCICEELFKLYLDPKFEDGLEESPPTLQQARRWFVDYLSCIYQVVDKHLRETIPKYSDKRVEFRFSVPTTWKDPGMIAGILQLMKNAGFGQSNPIHSAEINLTEAEAAAVYASTQQYTAGDNLLICDAGGGTTDVNILKVVSSGAGQTRLNPLTFVEGEAIGSTLIDIRMENTIAARLKLVRDHLKPGIDLDEVAWQMLHGNSRFESFKCNFGSDAMHIPLLRLPIPYLRSPIDTPHASIQNGCMIITTEELQAEFDLQIRKMITLIDGQLKALTDSHPGESITFVVLSGGLGSSPYLRSRFEAYYGLGRNRMGVIRNVQILSVSKPQLAVCHGLVLDRLQQIKENQAVYMERLCRNSYGIVCRCLYDPSIHTTEFVLRDERDGKDWVEQHIDWLVVQGQRLSVQEGVKRHYSLKIPPDQRDQPWTTQIVMSSLPKDQLPNNLRRPGVRTLCKVTSRLPSNMKTKNRKWYNFGETFLRAEFDMRVIIGAADLKFQTVSSDGVLSDGHNDIFVEWVNTERSKSIRTVELPLNQPYS